MSSIFDVESNKEKCQKFTPDEMVRVMLDLAGYTHDLMGKKVLEYSFGSGNILIRIVQRYIETSKKTGASAIEITKGLATDIIGIEYDKNLYNKCIERLNKVVKEYSLPKVEWALYWDDTLRWGSKDRFDYIIGNPPYITYKMIDEDSRKYIRENFLVCTEGKFDYCYAFLEKGIKLLSKTGIMVQLVPENIYKNVYAQKLRDMLLDHMVEILEYPGQNKFGSALTSSSIFLYDNSSNSDNLVYKNETTKVQRSISKSMLQKKWVFCEEALLTGKERLFSDCFKATISIATQLNKAFVISSADAAGLERKIIRSAASPRMKRNQKEEFIIFPYYINKNSVKHINEEEFKSKYPLAYDHLNQYYNELLSRDADKEAKWYEYGRSQGLLHINQEKLLISTVITGKVELYKLDKRSVPYSGIFITAKKGHTIEEAEIVLHSDDFFNYVMAIGISVNGKSKRITCRDINNYRYLEK